MTGRAHHPWFDKLTMGLEGDGATPTNLVLSLSKDGPRPSSMVRQAHHGLQGDGANSPTSSLHD
jgi:hypothetical protein